jgi:hypothetical protein
MTRPLSLASATGLALVLVTAAGCEAEVTSSGPPVAYAQTTAGPPGPPDPPGPEIVGGGGGDIVLYEQDAPVIDIDTYPTAVYGGVTVYYVGGMWYRHDDRGWGYYRQEPPDLARQRESHASDPRWVAARERPRQPSPQRSQRGAEPQRGEEPRPAAVPEHEAARPEVRPEEATHPAAEPKAGAPAAQPTVKRPAPRPKPEPERR